MQARNAASISTKAQVQAATRKGIAAIGLVALLVVPVLALVLLQRSGSPHLLGVGERAPSVTLQSEDSTMVSLLDVSGMPTVVFFFSVDGPHCRKQMPVVSAAQARFGGSVRFLAVSESTKEKTHGFVKSANPLPLVLLDEKGAAAKAFGVWDLPSLFLVGRDQAIWQVFIGEHSAAILENELARLTSETGDSGSRFRERNSREERQ